MMRGDTGARSGEHLQREAIRNQAALSGSQPRDEGKPERAAPLLQREPSRHHARVTDAPVTMRPSPGSYARKKGRPERAATPLSPRIFAACVHSATAAIHRATPRASRRCGEGAVLHTDDATYLEHKGPPSTKTAHQRRPRPWSQREARRSHVARGPPPTEGW